MTRFPVIDSAQLEAVTARPGIVLVDFWQASCAPCRALEPRLDRFAAAHAGAFDGYRIDVDTQVDAVTRHRVMSIPTIVVLLDGQEITRLDGLIGDADLDHALKTALTGQASDGST